MAKDLRATWGLPTARKSGFPLSFDEIAGTEVSIRVKGATTWTFLDRVPAVDGLNVFFQVDVDIGTWELRLVVEDKTMLRSDDLVTEFNVPDDSVPGTVVNVVVTLE